MGSLDILFVLLVDLKYHSEHTGNTAYLPIALGTVFMVHCPLLNFINFRS